MYARFKFDDAPASTTFANVGTVTGSLIPIVEDPSVSCQIDSIGGNSCLVVDTVANDGYYLARAIPESSSAFEGFQPSQVTIASWVYIVTRPGPLGAGIASLWGFGRYSHPCTLSEHDGSPAMFSWLQGDLWTTEDTMQGAWHHFAITYDGIHSKMYVNGTLQATVETPAIEYGWLPNTWIVGANDSAPNQQRTGFSDFIVSDSAWDSWIPTAYAAGPFGYPDTPETPSTHRFFIVLPGATVTPLASRGD